MVLEVPQSSSRQGRIIGTDSVRDNKFEKMQLSLLNIKA